MAANGVTLRCRWVELFAGTAWMAAVALGVAASGMRHWGPEALWAVVTSQIAVLLSSIAWHGHRESVERQRGVEQGLAMANIVRLGEYEHIDR